MEYKNILKSTSTYFEGKCVLQGWGNVYNIVDSKKDIVLPQAFVESLKAKSQLLMLLDHKFSQPIGRWIECKTDKEGLKVTGLLLTKLPYARIACELILQKTCIGLSIGYEVKKSYIRKDGVRIIEEAILHEVSVVQNPANQKAYIQNMLLNFQ